MPLAKSLMGSGASAGLTQSILGRVANTLTATGSASTDALLVTSGVNIVTTTASSTGVILPPGNGTVAIANIGDEIWIANHGAQTLTVYPPAGYKINNGSANSGISVATLKAALCKCIDGNNWTVIVGA